MFNAECARLLRKQARDGRRRIQRVARHFFGDNGAVGKVLKVGEHRRHGGGGLPALLNEARAEIFVERRINNERPGDGEAERWFEKVVFDVAKGGNEGYPGRCAGGKSDKAHLRRRYKGSLGNGRVGKL